MLHPSYTELMERINKDVEEGDTPIVQSRYSIVKATADRAKQIIDSRSIGDKIAKQIKSDPTSEPVISDSQHLTMKKGSPLIGGNTDDMKPLSIAIEELYKGYVKISERAETDAGEEAVETFTETNDEAENEASEKAEASEDVIKADGQDDAGEVVSDPEDNDSDAEDDTESDSEEDSDDSDDDKEDDADEEEDDKEDDSDDDKKEDDDK